MQKFKFLLAIPAYRCEVQIRRVLSGIDYIRDQIPEVETVVVFDNQSPDATFSEANEQVDADQNHSWIKVQKNETNVGLGGTHKIAFDYAHRNGFSHVVIFHGDDQGVVTDIPQVIGHLKKGSDAVLGSRFMAESKRIGYSYKRILGNRALNMAYTFLTGKRVRDLGSGLNGFRVSILDPSKYEKFSNQFTFNMDLLLELISDETKITFIPITWREVDQVSNANTFLVGWKALKTLIRWRFR